MIGGGSDTHHIHTGKYGSSVLRNKGWDNDSHGATARRKKSFSQTKVQITVTSTPLWSRTVPKPRKSLCITLSYSQTNDGMMSLMIPQLLETNPIYSESIPYGNEPLWRLDLDQESSLRPEWGDNGHLRI